MAKKIEAKADDMAARVRAICDSINKGDFGGEKHDAVNFLGDGAVIQMERFPSGCSTLDDALGGGWPKGRFIELFGAEAGGKCLTVDTYVYGIHGLMTVGEVFEKNGFIPSATTRNVEHSYPLLDEKGKLENTTHFYWNYVMIVQLNYY